MGNELYLYLKSAIGFQSQEIKKAFESIDRADFVLSEYKTEAYGDYPLPIGFGSTISQPSTVLMMLNWLDPKVGDNILDIGSGSGWTTALLAQIVGVGGEVQGVEIVPQLVEFGNQNIKKYKFKNAKIIQAGKKLGLSEQAPFDRILVSAAGEQVPQVLVDQLKVGGRMVLPVKNSVFVIDKISENETSAKEIPGFAFVPLR